jgi:hypothetical protein
MYDPLLISRAAEVWRFGFFACAFHNPRKKLFMVHLVGGWVLIISDYE